MYFVRPDLPLISRFLKAGTEVHWPHDDFEGHHEYIGKVIERNGGLVAINMYDSLREDESQAVKMVFDIEDVVDEMFIGI